MTVEEIVDNYYSYNKLLVCFFIRHIFDLFNKYEEGYNNISLLSFYPRNQQNELKTTRLVVSQGTFSSFDF